jgi:AraC-like DNA-binding protein
MGLLPQTHSPPLTIQRLAPRQSYGRRKIYMLAPGAIHPLIRFAHKLRSRLQIPERIIFDHELVYIIEGRGKLVFRGGELEIGPHCLLFLQPFVPHAFIADAVQPGLHVAVHFDFAELTPGLGRVDRRRPYGVRLTRQLSIPICTPLPEGHRIVQMMHETVRCQGGAEPWSALAQRHALTAVLLDLLRDSQRAHTARQFLNVKRVDRCARYVRQCARQRVYSADLARVAAVSPSHLRELFRSVTGYSPLEFVRRQRVEVARQMLADPSLAVKEVARRCGFDDVFHFSRVFRKIDGLAPTHYREALLTAGR